MNIIKGTNKLVFEDGIWFLGKLILLYITLPLTVMWIIIGVFFNADNVHSTIIGPSYFFIIFYAAIGYKSVLPIAMGMSSTRVQVLKSFYLAGISLVAALVFMVNVLQTILYTLYESGLSSVNIFHIAGFMLDEFNFISYLFIELGLLIFLFGITFLVSSIYYKLGMKKTLAGVMAISIPLTILYYAGALDKPFKSLMNLNININPVLFFALLGLAGLLALSAAYPIIKNLSLEKKTSRF